MGDLRPDNNGGLPDLPPEWGTVVIPDDAAELDAESVALRRELRREVWHNRLRALVGLGPAKVRQKPSLGIPIVIMAVAVITTLLSLFVVTWDHERSATTPAGPGAADPQTTLPLSEVTLADAAGDRVRLHDVLPAMLLLVEGCDCGKLISAVAAQAPKPVTVVAVSKAAACPTDAGKNLRCLFDPDGAVIGRFPKPTPSFTVPTAGPPTATAVGVQGTPSATPSRVPVPTLTAVPVDANGQAKDPIVVDSPDELKDALAALAGG
jgi:hypothetical protein